MTTAIGGRSPAEGRREELGAGSFRFGAVFPLTLVLCMFLTVAPDRTGRVPSRLDCRVPR
jgi:hypothetical protein